MLGRFRRLRSEPTAEVSDHHLLDLEGQIAAIHRVRAVIEFNLDGSILTANENFLNTVGYTLDEIVEQQHRMFLFPMDRDSASYEEFWTQLR